MIQLLKEQGKTVVIAEHRLDISRFDRPCVVFGGRKIEKDSNLLNSG